MVARKKIRGVIIISVCLFIIAAAGVMGRILARGAILERSGQSLARLRATGSSLPFSRELRGQENGSMGSE